MPTVPQNQSAIDPQALNLSRAIELQEGGGKPAYNAKGASGEQGAGQWMPGEFASDAKAAGLDPNDFSPENQDKVIYSTVKAKKDAGMQPAEIASEWNSGSPDNYTNHSGVNSKGVSYDTPAYVQGVKKYYGQLSQGQSQGQQYNAVQGGGNVQLNPADLPAPQQPGQTSVPEKLPDVGGFSPPTPPTQNAAPQSNAQTTDPGFLNDVTSGNVGGALEDAGNFLFPIAGDIKNDFTGQNNKSVLQQVGDAGLSALPFIPGLGEIGDAARGAELAGEGAADAAPGILAKLAGNKIVQGAGMGYGADVSSNLSQGKTGASVLTPGFGTLTGGVLGGGASALEGRGSGAGANVVNSLVKPLLKDFAYGKNPGRAIVEEGITGNSLDDLADNIGTVRKAVGAKIGEVSNSLPPMKLSLSGAVKPIDDAMQAAAKNNDTAVFNRLQGVKAALTQNLGMGADESGAPAIISKGARDLENQGYLDAQALKQHIGDMTKWTGNASDDKAVNLALKKAYGIVNQTMQDGVASLPEIGPVRLAQIQKLNERYGDLTTAETATRYRTHIEGRQNLISLGDTLTGAGAGALGQVATGNPIGAAVAGLAGAATKHLLGTAAVKTRIGSLLAGGGKSVLENEAPGIAKRIIPGLLKGAALRGATAANR